MEGNCVDKFIKKRIDNNIMDLLIIRLKIKNRIKERSETNDYFNTGCYEQDFSDIIKLRNTADQLSKECNKFLERISEQYSKLN